MNGTKQKVMAVTLRKSKSICDETGDFSKVEPRRFLRTNSVFILLKFDLMQTLTTAGSGPCGEK